MAAKHDGKRARANMWVTHQNLARSKGGRPAYQPPPKKPKKAPPSEESKSEDATTTEAAEKEDAKKP